MKANELRIGNWISIFGRNATIEDGIAIHALHTEMHPIPLTPEILEKCGFVKEEFVFALEYWHNAQDGHFIDKVRFVSKHGINVEIVGMNWVKVQYLHQLQTLYYALTGTELRVKL